MGMFDYVNFKMDCPNCGEKLNHYDFQTKDTGCTMDTVEPESVIYFYGVCKKCRTWMEFTRSPKKLKDIRNKPLTLDEVKQLGFKMEIEKK